MKTPIKALTERRKEARPYESSVSSEDDKKMPSDIVYYLRNLMFQMENPNIRNSVIHAFKNMIYLHPPDSQTMRRLALWMKKLRETNKEITAQRDRYFKLREQYEKEGKSLLQAVGEMNLPPFLIGGQSENSHIYEALEKIAQKHFLPGEIVRELGLALEGDENKPPGNDGTIVLADNLLNAPVCRGAKTGAAGGDYSSFKGAGLSQKILFKRFGGTPPNSGNTPSLPKEFFIVNRGHGDHTRVSFFNLYSSGLKFVVFQMKK